MRNLKTIFRNFAFAIPIVVMIPWMFTNSSKNSDELDNISGLNQSTPSDSCVLAISISNYKSYKDYEISIWIQNNFSHSVIAPFNLASLLNEDEKNPILNLRLLSTEDRTSYLIKQGSVVHFLSDEANKCLNYDKAEVKNLSDIRFSFNIQDIFGSDIPKHDRFFFEYKYKSKVVRDLLESDSKKLGHTISDKNLDYKFYTRYKLEKDTLIGNVLSAIADHKVHLKYESAIKPIYY